MGRLLPPGLYGFGDLEVSDRLETGEVKVTADLIDRFAGLTGDRFEIHMTSEAAQKHGFAARVAHGLLVLSLVDGLKNQAPAQFRAIASLGWDWTFRQPVLADDCIRATITISEKRPTRREDRFILHLSLEVINQRGEVVQLGRNILMVQR